MYRVEIDGRAQRELNRLQGSLLERLLQAIAGLQTDPRPAGCMPLAGPAGAYRLRVGDYRILYDVADRERLVTVWRVRHRRDAYRDL